MKPCLWKTISETESKEGIRFKEQHPEIPFIQCRYECCGFKGYGIPDECKWYEERK